MREITGYEYDLKTGQLKQANRLIKIPTPEDIAKEDWDFLKLSQRVQITLIWIDPDDATLNHARKAKLKDCLQYWQLAELPIKRRNGFCYLYFDSLEPNQLAFLATIGVTPEPRPVMETSQALKKDIKSN